MASSLGWDRYVGEEGIIIDIDRFGALGNGDKIVKQYGFTDENIVNKVAEVGTKRNSRYETRSIFQVSERNIRRLLPQKKTIDKPRQRRSLKGLISAGGKGDIEKASDNAA